jgi:Tfp pilus assembly protein PilF
MGAFLVSRGDTEEGVQYLKRSIELGGMTDAYYNLAAVTLSSGGSSVQAAKLLRQCLRLDPDNAAAMELLAKLLADPELVGLYDPDESRSLIERAQALQGK